MGEQYGRRVDRPNSARFNLTMLSRWRTLQSTVVIRFGVVAILTIASLGVSAGPAAATADQHPCTDSAVTRGEAAFTVEYRHQVDMVRLYCAAFFREPDAAGFEYWDDEWQRFVNVYEQAKYFTESDEFVQRFGSDLTTEEFLTVLYDHVFLREPDPAGLEYWVELMTVEPVLSREGALMAFAQSAEMANQVPLPAELPRRERAFLVRQNPWGSGIMLGIDQVVPRDVPPLTQLPGSGVFINTTIYPYWNQLTTDARAAGYTIRVGPGGGYRSFDAQVQARIRNGCPDIYVSDSDTCRIPTSRPGESNHQSGLALDLDLGGSSRGTLGWLRTHAHEYGFYAFFSTQQPWGEMTDAERERSLVEPWHWSHNGR